MQVSRRLSLLTMGRPTVALQFVRGLSVLAASSRPSSTLRMSAAGSRGAGAPALISTSSEMFAAHQPIARRAMEYLDGSPDPFHATENMCALLRGKGWIELDEREPWAGKIKPGGKYFYTRNRSCLVALAVGAGYTPGNGFKVIGAHTDSPNLRIKPRSKRSGSGCIQLDVRAARRREREREEDEGRKRERERARRKRARERRERDERLD